MTLSDTDRAINYIATLYGNSGINENTVYRIFKNFIKDENKAINAAREFINTQCDVKTVTTKLFKKSAFL
tara:strand:+ start:359 stop:568 length:210 start_codon:yes stop_codon:yes gene_type:complete